ncbi:MAG: DUF4185 domain-containing protein [Bacteroidales bacterium]|nr:DUF4185 domain-containing protein [Bacteroidales bacterium]
MKHLLCFIISVFSLLSNLRSQPYPLSEIGVKYNEHTKEQCAPGSDNFQVTWADDDHQYAAWGDGGGFGGTNSEGRVKLGVARIEGDKNNYFGTNVWGGFKSENAAKFKGKSWGMICIDSTLYMWVTTEQHPHIKDVTLAYSVDHGAHWTKSDVKFYNSENMTIPTFLQFGRAYSDARDDYVYSYFIHSLLQTEDFGISKPGKIYLARVLKDYILDKSKYEYFAGINDSTVLWSNAVDDKKPVFINEIDGVGWNLSVSYNKPLQRYFLMTEHTETIAGYHGIFDAPTPWGPWTTAEYVNGNWLDYGSTFFRCFSNKWLSMNGKDFVMIFTGTNMDGNNDAWNLIEGSFIQK